MLQSEVYPDSHAQMTDGVLLSLPLTPFSIDHYCRLQVQGWNHVGSRWQISNSKHITDTPSLTQVNQINSL